MEPKKITRKQLYDLVWSKPMTALGKEFGYSDTALRKKCIKHNIPMPERGYWSKLKFNKKVKKPSLPTNSDDLETITLYINENIDPDYKPTTSKLIIRKKEIMNESKLKLVVPDKLKNPDALTIKAKEDLKLKHPSMWAGKQGLLLTSKDVLNIEVSKATVSRALLFMDTLIKVIKNRGHQIEVNDKTFVVIDEIKIEIRFREILKVVKIPANIYETREYAPSGEVAFKVDSYPSKEWRDTKTETLEVKLPTIIAKLELIAEDKKARRFEHRLWQEQQDEIEKKRKALQKQKDEELKGLKTLLNASTRLHKAQYIRSYIEQFEEQANRTNTLSDEKKEWLEWAKEKADWYDPFIEKEVKLLEEVDRDTLEYKRKNYW